MKPRFAHLQLPLVALSALWGLSALAARDFGYELELGALDRIEEDKPSPSRYREVLENAERVTGSKGGITYKPFERKPELSKALYLDPQGRTWQAVPEYINGAGIDGFELITPRLNSGSEADLVAVENVIKEIERGGKFGPGLFSSGHLTMDASDLITSEGDVGRAIKTILFIENNWPTLYNAATPMRGGRLINRYAVPLAVNQQDLLRQLALLLKRAPEKRTMVAAKKIFENFYEKEKQILGTTGIDDANWKFRAANYKKFFGLDGVKQSLVFEWRLLDLPGAEKVRSQVQLFEAVMDKGADFPGSTEFVDWVGKEDWMGRKNPEAKIGSLGDKKYNAVLRSLGLDPKDYPKLGAIGGSLSHSFSSRALKREFTRTKAEALLSGEVKASFVSRGKATLITNTSQIGKLQGHLFNNSFLDLEVRGPIDADLQARLKDFWENFGKANQADAIVSNLGNKKNPAPLVFDSSIGRVKIRVPLQYGSHFHLEEALQGMLLGLRQPDKFLPIPPQTESLTALMEKYRARYYGGGTLSGKERGLLRRLEQTTSNLPLRNLATAPHLSPLEKKLVEVADSIFGSKVNRLLLNHAQEGRVDAAKELYEEAVRSWLASSEATKRLRYTSHLKKSAASTALQFRIECAGFFSRIVPDLAQ